MLHDFRCATKANNLSSVLSDATLFQLKLLLLELLRKEHDGILVHSRLQAGQV